MIYLLFAGLAFFSTLAVLVGAVGPASTGMALVVLVACWREIRGLRRELEDCQMVSRALEENLARMKSRRGG